jgi:hypothetical protein
VADLRQSSSRSAMFWICQFACSALVSLYHPRERSSCFILKRCPTQIGSID